MVCRPTIVPLGRLVGATQHIASLSLLTVVVLPSPVAAQTPPGRPGVEPANAWTCPLTHPIKGNFTPTNPRELCIYHVQGGQYYEKTKPERCYATDDDARRDGCRRSKR